jgi:predicted ABC-type ATPase
MTTREQYQKALESMDWKFEFSDDNTVYRAGRDELRELHKLQAEVDKNGAIWYSYVDAKFGGRDHGMPGPLVGVFA